MKTYPLPDGTSLPALGLGTWRMGGGMSADTSRDAEVLEALRYALQIGYRHFDTAEIYGNGHAEELLGRALRESGIPREEIFLTSKIWPDHLTYAGTLRACEGSLRRLGTEYLDLYLIHWPPSLPLEEGFRALNALVREGRVRYLGVSNIEASLMRRAAALSETPLLTNQVPYSLFNRDYARNGVLKYCQEHGILLTAYTPLEKGRLANSPVLASIAEARGATPAQIALAWLLAQPGVITIPKAVQRRHLEENLVAADIQLTPEEMRALDALA